MGEKPKLDPQTAATQNVERLYAAMRLRRAAEAAGRVTTDTALEDYMLMGELSHSMPNDSN